MKVDSKRRWKARILHPKHPDIPTYVTTYYPELIFWLLHYDYSPGRTHWQREIVDLRSSFPTLPNPTKDTVSSV